jgi:TolA-binding protein
VQERQQREQEQQQQQQQEQQRQREEQLRQREQQVRQREQQLQRDQHQQRQREGQSERAREEQDGQRVSVSVSSEDSDVPVISMEILDLNLRPLAAGSYKDVHEARLCIDVPGIGNAGLKVAVLQLRHGTATLAAELQVFKNEC